MPGPPFFSAPPEGPQAASTRGSSTTRKRKGVGTLDIPGEGGILARVRCGDGHGCVTFRSTNCYWCHAPESLDSRSPCRPWTVARPLRGAAAAGLAAKNPGVPHRFETELRARGQYLPAG